jgi:hypothetical protein
LERIAAGQPLYLNTIGAHLKLMGDPDGRSLEKDRTASRQAFGLVRTQHSSARQRGTRRSVRGEDKMEEVHAGQIRPMGNPDIKGVGQNEQLVVQLEKEFPVGAHCRSEDRRSQQRLG